MPDAQLVFLSPAWRDLDRISDLHMMLAETKSAKEITDKLLDTIALLAEQPYMGALHPDPFYNRDTYTGQTGRERWNDRFPPSAEAAG